MREIINKYGAIIGVSILVLAALSYWLLRPSNSPPTGDSSKAFFVDEETGAESTHPITDIPPLIGKSGKRTVVQAFKFSCDNGKNPQVKYYRRYTEEAQAQLKGMAEDDVHRPDVLSRGEEVREPGKGKQWVKGTTTDGMAIKAPPDCPGGKVVAVYPR